MSFEPRNPLERLLVQAANDPAARPDFARAVLDSTVYVIGDAGDARRIQSMTVEDRQVTPVFTSEERVAAYAPGARSVAMTARDLLAVIGPRELLMNPGSSYGKHFLPEEVQALLDGSAFRPRETWVAEKATEMLIGVPAKVPHRFVDALRTFFAGRAEVRRAYLALISIPARSSDPNLYLAIETDGDLQSIAADCGIIAGNTLAKGEFVDIGTPSIAPDYFAGAEPFYTRIE